MQAPDRDPGDFGIALRAESALFIPEIAKSASCVAWPAYAVATSTLSFTLPMKIARLALSTLCTLLAGAIARRLSPARWLPVAVGCVLIVLFLPEHYLIWSHLPVWYHLTFLGSLIPLAVIGSRLVVRSENLARAVKSA
jgi:hypothetical protein